MKRTWDNWPTIDQLIEAYNAFSTSYERVWYKGDGVFIEEAYTRVVWCGELEVDTITEEISYLQMYKLWLAYEAFKKEGMPIPTPSTEIAEDDAPELPF